MEEFNGKKNKEIFCESTFQIGPPQQTFKPLITHEFFYTFTDLEGYGPPELITIKDFLRKEEFFPRNALQIRLHITLLSEPKSSSLNSSLFSSQEETLSKSLAKSLEKLFLSQEHSDSQLISQGQTFSDHGAILAARSSTFASMLDAEGGEGTIRTLTIEDVSGEILEILLKFIYTGNIEMPPALSEWDDILVAIDKFQLTDLKESAIMASSNDDETAAKFALNAWKFKAGGAGRRIIVDYCQTRFALLMKNPDFKRALLESPQAFAED